MTELKPWGWCRERKSVHFFPINEPKTRQHIKRRALKHGDACGITMKRTGSLVSILPKLIKKWRRMSMQNRLDFNPVYTIRGCVCVGTPSVTHTESFLSSRQCSAFLCAFSHRIFTAPLAGRCDPSHFMLGSSDTENWVVSQGHAARKWKSAARK